MMQYGISTVVLGRTDLELALRWIAAAGFTQIEILAEPPHLAPGNLDPQKVRAWLDELGLAARVGHGIYSYQTPNCGALDEAERRRSVRFVATCFEPLAAVGAQFVVLHPTGYSLDYTADKRQKVLDQARKSMDELATLGARAGIRIAWENLPHHGTERPLHDMAELRALIDDLPEHVGLCLDTTHALIAGHDPVEQLEVAFDRLFCLHLHDSDGEGDCHWVPGRGVIDWQGFIARLDERCFAGTRTIEVMSTDETEDEVLAQALAVARQWHRAGRAAL